MVPAPKIDVKRLSYADGCSAGRIHPVGDEVTAAFLKEVKAQALAKDAGFLQTADLLTDVFKTGQHVQTAHAVTGRHLFGEHTALLYI